MAQCMLFARAALIQPNPLDKSLPHNPETVFAAYTAHVSKFQLKHQSSTFVSLPRTPTVPPMLHPNC